jgi:hypothetical protein
MSLRTVRLYVASVLSASLLGACIAAPRKTSDRKPNPGERAAKSAARDAGGLAAEPTPDAASNEPNAACVAEPLRVNTSAGRFATVSMTGSLDGRGTHSSRTWATCADDRRVKGRFFQLDLSDFHGALRLHLVVDADFAPIVSIQRGTCEDPAALRCAQPVADGNVVSLSEEIDPGLYLVFIAGPASQTGNFRLELGVESSELNCEAPANAECSAPTQVDVHRTSSTFLVQPDCADGEVTNRHYKIDLSQETSRVAIRVDHQLPDPLPGTDPFEWVSLSLFKQNDTTDCPGEFVVKQQTFNGFGLGTVVEPGKYILVYSDVYAEPSRLQVQFTRPDCSGNHRTCQDAETVPLEGDYAVMRGHTHCSANELQFEDCSSAEGVERLFRVDLTERPGLVRLRARLLMPELKVAPALMVVEDRGGECGALLSCFEPIDYSSDMREVDMILKPAVYFVGIEVDQAAASGSFALEFDVSAADSRSFRACYDGDVRNCEFNNENNACCRNPLHHTCSTLARSCGLDPAVHDCVCATDPVCCDGTEADLERCTAAFSACNYFCDASPTNGGCSAETILRGGSNE